MVGERGPLRATRAGAPDRPGGRERRDLPRRPAQPTDLFAAQEGGPRVARRHAADADPRAAQRDHEGRLRTTRARRRALRRESRPRGAGRGAAFDRAVRAEIAKRRAGPGSPLSFIFVAVYVDMIGYGIVVPLLPFYAREHASGAVLVGLLGSLYAAAQFVGGPFLGGLSDRAGRRLVLLLWLLGASLTYLLLGLADSLPLLVAAVALAGLAGATLATAQAYIADVTPHEDRARGRGLVGAAFGLGL